MERCEIALVRNRETEEREKKKRERRKNTLLFCVCLALGVVGGVTPIFSAEEDFGGRLLV